MDVMRKILNIFGILIATVLSIVLTVVLLVVPIFSAASSFTQGETLHKVLGEIDYSEVIASSALDSTAVNSDAISSDEISQDVLDSTQEMGFDSKIIEDLMGTEAIGEVLDLYIDDAFAALERNTDEVSLTPEALQGIASEHMDELVMVAKQFLGDDLELTDEQVGELVSQTVEEYGDTIIEMLPPVEELIPVQQEEVQEKSEQIQQADGFGEASIQEEDAPASLETVLLETLMNLRNGKIVTNVVIAVVILSALILLCRMKRFQGFMWLGVVYMIATVLTLITALLVGGSGVMQLFEVGFGGEEIIAPILSVLSSEMMKGAMILAGCAVLFIVVFVVGRKVSRRKM